MNYGTKPVVTRAINVTLVAACLLQAALAYSDVHCTSPHGTQCRPVPSGCTESVYPDVPSKCCYMANSRLCCQMSRTKHVYTGNCPGMPPNCSDCNGDVYPAYYATCITAGSGEGWCE